MNINLPDNEYWSKQTRLEQWQHAIGRIHFSIAPGTYNPEKLLDEKLTLLKNYAAGKVTRMFVLDMADETGILKLLEDNYNVAIRLGHEDIALGLEKILQAEISKRHIEPL